MSFFLSRNKQRGFTIVELVIVIVVIGILAALSIVAYSGVQTSARDKSILSDIDAVEGEIARYSTKNAGALGSAVVWYSNGAANPNLKVSLSSGNVVDIVAGKTDYCIRGYNPASNKTNANNSFTKESSPGMCSAMPPSVAAGGTWSDSIVGWWRLNGNALDASGNTSGGTVTGAAVTTGQNGQPATAYSFNGTGDYINLGLSKAVGSLTGNLTVSAWVNQPSYSTSQIILGVSRYRSSNGVGLATITNYPRFTMYGVKDYSATSATLSPNNWYLLTAVMGTTNVDFYVNGVFVQTVTHTVGGTTNLDDDFILGASTAVGSDTLVASLTGKVDDVRVYNTMLSAGDVAALYSAGAQ